MIATVAPTPAPDTAPYRPLLARVRDTFVAPARLFASFRDDAPWVGALALATVIAAAAVAAEPPEFYLDQMENPVNRRGVPVEITSPPEQIVLWGRVMAIFSGLVGHPMLAFAGAGVLALIFRVIPRGEGGFRQYLAISSHALLILSVGMLVATALRAVTGSAAILPTIGAVVGAPSSGIAGAALHGLNLFTLWMLAVAAVGVATVEPRVTRAPATAILWGLYAALVVTGALLFRP